MIRPKTYNQEGKKITFNYSFKDLREFIKRGKEYGDCGWIIVRYDNGIITYKGFGTIENPSKWIITFSMMHDPVYDGEFSIDKIMNGGSDIFKHATFEYKILNL